VKVNGNTYSPEEIAAILSERDALKDALKATNGVTISVRNQKDNKKQPIPGQYVISVKVGNQREWAHSARIWRSKIETMKEHGEAILLACSEADSKTKE
jgi:hypothetical protein